MIRSSTPQHSFLLPFDYGNNVAKLLVSFKQDDKIILEKTGSDVQFSGKKFWYTLSQEETKMFSQGVYKLQVKILSTDGNVLVSKIYYLRCEDVLDDREM